jgi:acetyltransferase-like isoleucine patch superfamily enzyme
MLRIINILIYRIKNIKNFFFKIKVKFQSKSVGLGLRVNNKSNVTSSTILGNNVNFNGMMIEGKGFVRIGNNFHSGKECCILTDIHNYDKGNALPYDETFIIKDVTIEDNVWLGNRVIILGGVKIGEGAIIQAGSVVVNNIPKYAIAGGHPAKVFKYRDINHYKILKKQKKFN